MTRYQASIICATCMLVPVAVVHAEPRVPQEKSPQGAAVISVFGPLLSVGSMVVALETGQGAIAVAAGASLLVTPSLGQIYAGDGRGARIDSGIRLGAALLAAKGTIIGDQGGDDASLFAGVVLIVAGAATATLSSIISIARAPGAARAFNRRRATSQFTLMPIVTQSSLTAGAGFGGVF